jgi:hypothetical protein
METKIESNTIKGKFYTVRHTFRGWECNCEFQEYHPRRKCRHIAKVIGICRKSGCIKKPVGRQLCREHYNKWYRVTHKRKIKSYRRKNEVHNDERSSKRMSELYGKEGQTPLSNVQRKNNSVSL